MPAPETYLIMHDESWEPERRELHRGTCRGRWGRVSLHEQLFSSWHRLGTEHSLWKHQQAPFWEFVSQGISQRCQHLKMEEWWDLQQRISLARAVFPALSWIPSHSCPKSITKKSLTRVSLMSGKNGSWQRISSQVFALGFIMRDWK